MTEKVGPWSRMPCDACGCEFQASRTKSRVAPFICAECEVFERASRAASVAERSAVVKYLREWGSVGRYNLYEIANEIERGDHWETKP